MATLSVPQEDIFLHLDVATQKEALEFVCARLLETGKIKEGYLEALLAREEIYPTGLDLAGINVAIPHTDYEWSNTTQLVVATFAQPIEWKNMEDADETVNVSMMVMSLFNNPEHQLDALQQIMAVIQNQDTVARIVATDDVREISQAFDNRKE